MGHGKRIRSAGLEGTYFLVAVYCSSIIRCALRSPQRYCATHRTHKQGEDKEGPGHLSKTSSSSASSVMADCISGATGVINGDYYSEHCFCLVSISSSHLPIVRSFSQKMLLPSSHSALHSPIGQNHTIRRHCSAANNPVTERAVFSRSDCAAKSDARRGTKGRDNTVGQTS